MATIKERIDFMTGLHLTEMDIMARKAHDYSGDQDCNKNIRACEMVGICTAEQGIMIRLFDKFQRLTNLINGETAKVKESRLDTIMDARNYLGILAHVMKEKGLV